MLVQALAKTSKIDEAKLMSIAGSASKRYKVYHIPKRTEGTRKIEHPSQELKAIQRWIVKAVFNRFPLHQSATAYRIGSGIRDNAERHRHTKYTNRYDFSNFFPSFRQERIEEFTRIEAEKLDMGLTSQDIKFIGAIVCRHGRLTIGAPSSPMITNTMMFEFDRNFFGFCDSNDLIYTRYADDIFVSSNAPNSLLKLEDEIRKAKRDVPHLGLRINHKKTTYLSKKHSRRVTGVVITTDHRLSIGRERKREIKSLIHRWLNNKLEMHEAYYMRGLLAFARDIEPEFEGRLRAKYGEHSIDEILRNPSLQSGADPNFFLF